MADERLRRVAAAVGRIAGPVRWVVRVVTGAAVLAASAGVLVWAGTDAGALDEWWRGTLRAVLVLLVLLVPAGWLLNVRLALTGLLGLPAELDDVARRRGAHLRGAPVERPGGGIRGTVRAVRAVAADYASVTGSWALVVQLVTPWFWGMTVLALVAVPVLLVAALVVSVGAAI